MKTTVIILVTAVLAALDVSAHVVLEYPNGPETFRQGEMVEIRWNINAAHPLVDWDLWYSLDGSKGPWYDLAIDLPKGDTSQESVHSYIWIVPEIQTEQLRIRIRQDNVEYDWEDTSRFDMVVLSMDCCDGYRGDIDGDDQGLIEISDLAALVDYLFRSGRPPRCSLEANIDGSTDGAINMLDLVYLVGFLYGAHEPPMACPD